MSLQAQIGLIKELLESAEANLKSAKQVIGDLLGKNSKKDLEQAAETLKKIKEQGGGGTDIQQIIEGEFTGQQMIGSDGKEYPVPPNYASKSKLVQGDKLKLTIAPDGAFIYKQIGPSERKRIVGTLVYENGQYKILAEGKAYKVLLASVTYFRAEVGDMVTVLVPEKGDVEWGAIENVLPKEGES